MKKFFCYLTILSVSVMLAACSSSSSSKKADPTVISGTAAKGIIDNGNVTAWELKADGTNLAEVGSATTDEHGAYQLTLNANYSGGVVKVQITPGAGSQMKCDDFNGCGTVDNPVAFGSWMDLPTEFSMDAVLKPTGTSVSVQITPLTHMAAARALAEDTVDAAAVADANSEVSQMVGVNIIQSEVVDITDPASLAEATGTGRQYALFNAGIAGMLTPAEGETKTLVEKLDDLAASFEDGQLSAAEIEDITDSVEEAVASASSNPDISEILESEISIIETVIAVIDDNTGVDGYDPEPSDGAGQSAIDQVKALVTDARTLVEQIVKDYETPIEVLDIDADAIEDVMNKDVQIMAQLLGETVEQVVNYVDNDLANVTVESLLAAPKTTYSLDIENSDLTKMGTVTVVFTSDATGLSFTINGTLTGEQTVEIIEDDLWTVEDETETFKGTQTVTITDLTVATSLKAGDIDITGDLLSTIAAQNVKLTASGKIGNAATSIELKNTEFNVGATKSVSFDFTENGDNDDKEQDLSSASFKGAMEIKAAEATFSGDVEIVLVALNTNINAEFPLSLEKLAVNGDFTSPGVETFTSSATLNISNAASFDTFGYFDYDEDVYVNDDVANDSFSDELRSFLDAQIASNKGDLDVVTYYRVSYNSYETDQVFLEIWGTEGGIDNVRKQAFVNISEAQRVLMINNIAFEYSDSIEEIHWFSLWPSSVNTCTIQYEAGLKDFESADNFVQGTLTVSTSVKIDGIPASSATVTASRTDFRGGEASVTLTHDGHSYTIAAESDDVTADDNIGTVTITNPDGVKIVINASEELDEITGVASVGDVKVADIEASDFGPLIRYEDGTFDSIY